MTHGQELNYHGMRAVGMRIGLCDTSDSQQNRLNGGSLFPISQRITGWISSVIQTGVKECMVASEEQRPTVSSMPPHQLAST